MTTRTIVAVSIAITIGTGVAVAQVSQSPRCLTSRLVSVGKLALCQLREHATAIAREEAVDVSGCVDAFVDRWAAIDNRSSCQPVAPSASASALALTEDFVLAILNLLNPPAPNRIFTTRQAIFPGVNPGIGTFDSLSAAGQICTTLAHQNPALAGTTFTPLLCGRQAGVADNANLGIAQRVNDSPNGIVRVDGVWVADNLADLLDGSIDAPLSHDQFGLLLPDIEVNDVIPVWSGCTATGDPLPLTSQCTLFDSWSGTVGLAGSVGRPDRTDSQWLEREGNDSCGRDRHLYCIEQ